MIKEINKIQLQPKNEIDLVPMLKQSYLPWVFSVHIETFPKEGQLHKAKGLNCFANSEIVSIF